MSPKAKRIEKKIAAILDDLEKLDASPAATEEEIKRAEEKTRSVIAELEQKRYFKRLG